jgi:carbamoyl-phosphate synthase small subunit
LPLGPRFETGAFRGIIIKVKRGRSIVKIGLPRLHVHRAFDPLDRTTRDARPRRVDEKTAMNAPDVNLATSAALFPPVMPALLALADGTVFRGQAIGATGTAVGEVVFNTAMTGYQEILTDPSYAGQIVTLTYPHIGNVGVNDEDVESTRIHVAGLVIRDLSRVASSWRSQQDLATYLRTSNIVGIADIDTRKLTRILRERGAQNGCMVAGPGLDDTTAEGAVAKARAVPSMAGLDLAKVVSCTKPYEWTSSTWSLADGYRPMGAPRFHVVAYDYGVKHNILRMLAARGCRLTVVPAQMPAREVLAMKPDGVFLSNGPGDPEPCDYAITAIREVIASGMPVFGICLGHQLLGLAAGGRTLKMKFGHHGANHPVLDRDTGQVLITSQNHGFAVDPASLPANVRVTHVSLFDGTLQGFAWTDKPVFCFQGHPEASPGPHDLGYLFDRFVKLMEAKGHSK